MDFLSCGKKFLLLNLFFLQVETFAEISGKNYWEKDFAVVKRDFPPSGKCFRFFRAFFLKVETVTETS